MAASSSTGSESRIQGELRPETVTATWHQEALALGRLLCGEENDPLRFFKGSGVSTFPEGTQRGLVVHSLVPSILKALLACNK
eukprot:CAMPEP_0117649134 /NCGR_PEP_ID=MMETSP0804-20121206/802_1 /TAXON_ID=1074897 /ORGANISM="Tetraselmis astigmatica, Strain CCMP880" /LENGTH=82 /DNA_ID=CAMNT_0005454835 /DNA_START=347 /DNA_END=595 /DNA_ORIENTATION=+